MDGKIELRTKHQFAGLVERRDRLNGSKNDPAVQARFAELIGPRWAQENCALEEVDGASRWSQSVLDERRILHLNRHISVSQWFWSGARNQASLSTADLLEVHRRLLEGISPHAGRFREGEIRPLVEGQQPIEADLVPYAVANALEWFSSDSFHEMHEVEKTALILMKMMDIFPFQEGNGPTLRLFANFFLLNTGYPPAIIPSSQAGRYAAALQNSFRLHTQPLIDLLTEAVLEGLRYSLAEPCGHPQFHILR